MKNFFSQTWVVAGLVVIVLGVVCYIAYKSKANDSTDPEADPQADPENKD